MTNMSPKPWETWPHELPLKGEPAPHCEQYDLVKNYDFIREMGKEVRAKVLEEARKQLPRAHQGAIVLKGGCSDDFELYDSDTTHCEFRQEAFFRYMFPINEPDCYAMLNLQTGQSHLFVPPVTPAMARWNGPQHTEEWYVKRYGVNGCHNAGQMHEFIKQQGIA